MAHTVEEAYAVHLTPKGEPQGRVRVRVRIGKETQREKMLLIEIRGAAK